MTRKKESKRKRGASRPKGTKVDYEPFSSMSLLKLKAGCKDTRDSVIISFLLETGIRVSDLCAVTWDLLKKDDEGHSYIEYTSLKTKTLTKAVITEQTRELLNKWKNEREADNHRVKDQRIFPYTTEWIRELLRKIKKRGKVKRKVRPHDFCVTTMTRMGKAGKSAKLTGQQVGRTPEMVRAVYEKYSIEDKAKAVKEILSMDAILSEVEEK